MPKEVQAVAFIIQAAYSNNDEIRKDIEKKLAEEVPNELKALKEEKVETHKSLKSACNALNEVDAQLTTLREEQTFNLKSADEMRRMWQTIKDGREQVEVPSEYFKSLVVEFDAKMKKYTRQIEEME